MNQVEHESVRERCRRSRELNEQLTLLIGRRPANSLRVDFARCAQDLALEHHSAIARTVDAGEFGAAGALLRPLLEASTTAYWFVYAANCVEICRLPTTTVDTPAVDIPGLSVMLSALTPIFPPITRISEGLKTGGAAKWLHKYTHGGTPQLTRRSAEGWTVDEAMRTLVRADMFVTLSGLLETVLDPSPELASYAFGSRDELGFELQITFGALDRERQPDFLPDAPLLLDGCGQPFNR